MNALRTAITLGLVVAFGSFQTETAGPGRAALRPEEAAQLLGVSRSTLYELLRHGPSRGGLASFRIGRSRRITPEAIADFVARAASEEQSA